MALFKSYAVKALKLIKIFVVSSVADVFCSEEWMFLFCSVLGFQCLNFCFGGLVYSLDIAFDFGFDFGMVGLLLGLLATLWCYKLIFPRQPYVLY